MPVESGAWSQVLSVVGWAAGMLAVLTLVGMGIGWIRGGQEPPNLPVAAGAQDGQNVSPSHALAALPARSGLIDRRWLPRDTAIVLRFSPAALPPDGAIPQPAQSWYATYRAIVDALGLKPQAIHRMTLIGADLGAWPEQCLSVVELVEGQRASVLDALGERSEVLFHESPCRRLTAVDWPHLLSVVDERTLVTGPERLLRAVSDRGGTALDRPGMEDLIGAFSADSDWAVVLDLAAARAAKWSLPSHALDVWPAGSSSWHTLWQLPEAVGCAFLRNPRVQAEVGWVCRDADDAAQLRATLDQWTSAAREALAAQAAPTGEPLRSGETANTTTRTYQPLLSDAARIVDSARWEQVRELVWLRAPMPRTVAELASGVHANEGALRGEWLRAGMGVDRTNHKRLLDGLAAFEKADGNYPAGAAGSSVLPPDSRVSWIGMLLPYLGYSDRREQLDPSYAWNAPPNEPITRRPLPEVANPILGPQKTPDGYPVTHYAGLAGVGADAGYLHPNDPRAGVFGYNRTTRPEEIADGAANTIAVVGIGDKAGAWAAGGTPTVRPLTAQPYVNGPDGFGSGQPNGMLVGMADGSVRFVAKDVDPRVFEQLATVSGGESALASHLGTSPWEPRTAIPPNTECPPATGGPMAGASPAAVVTPHAESSAAPEATDALVELSAGAMPAQPIHVDLAAGLAVRIPRLQFVETPWLAAVRLVARLGDVPLGIDREIWKQAGDALLEPTTLELTDTNVGESLKTLAAMQSLTCRRVETGLMVALPEPDRERLVPLKHDVLDLAGTPAETTELARMVTAMVRPSTWQSAGGRGKIAVEGSMLALEQTPQVEREVLALLETLRAVRGRQPVATDCVSIDDYLLPGAAAEGDQLLLRPVTIGFQQPAPLGDILPSLESVSDATILVDWPALAAVGVTRRSMAQLNADNKPLGDALSELLEPLRLGFEAREGGIRISSRAELDKELEPVVYQIGMLRPGATGANSAQPQAATNGTLDQVIVALRQEVAPPSWTEAGGTGRVDVDRISGCLVVLQSPAVHSQIRTWLRNHK
ncbi:MAG: DUF1559 domain-containing protein [Planctomycetota bacterium]